MSPGVIVTALELIGLYVFVAAAYPTGLPVPVVAVGAAVLIFAFRVAAMVRHWTAPRAWTSRGPVDTV